MVLWVIGSIPHGASTGILFSFYPVLHEWLNKNHGMYFPVCEMVHIKDPLLLTGKSRSRFCLPLSTWYHTMVY